MAPADTSSKDDMDMHLRHRVRQETTAALKARTVSATIIHVILATAYAKRLQVRRGQTQKVPPC